MFFFVWACGGIPQQAREADKIVVKQKKSAAPLYIFCTINEKNELHNNVIILSKGDL